MNDPNTAKRPVMKPGQTNSGSFKSGHDPKRSTAGWSNVHRARTVEDKFQQHADEAIRKLRSLMADETASHAVQAKAAVEILDRAYGRSVDRVAIANVNNTHTESNVRSLSNKQLLEIALQGVVEVDTPNPDSDSTDLSVVSDQ